MTIFQNNVACLTIDVGWGIVEEQAKLVAEEFDEFKKNNNTIAHEMFFHYFDSITTSNLGNFAFEFDDEVLSLSQNEQEELKETMNELFENTQWFKYWKIMDSISSAVLLCDRKTSDDEKFIQSYIFSSVVCGFKIGDKLLEEVFESYLSKVEIKKEAILLKRIYSDKWTY